MSAGVVAGKVHDVLGIGLGPFNLSLACLMAPLRDLDAVFLERKNAFSWHDGMMIPGTTLQNNFIADLVTLADPTSRFSYLNYCKQQGKIYHYYFRENFYLTRQEYNKYCQWAAAQLDCVRYGKEVAALDFDEAAQCYVAQVQDLASGRKEVLRARKLVVGIGSEPNLPACVDAGYASCHTGRYLTRKEKLRQAKRIVVVGSGQSGAEIYSDLLQDIEKYGYELYWITRSSRFFQMETGRLTLELITPDYADYFYQLDEAQKAATLQDQNSIFNGINTSLIERIYEQLDELSATARKRAHLYSNMELLACKERGGQSELVFRHMQTRQQYRLLTDGLVFATGYGYRIPAFMHGLSQRIHLNANGRYRQARNYSVDINGQEIYVQNAGFDSHGLTNPDLGLNCFRNARIINSMLGREVYTVESGTTFQDFTPEGNSQFEQLSEA